MKISVIIPLYNSEMTIEHCLMSVLNELISKKFEWEIVIIDDGSTDNSVSVVKKVIESNANCNIRLINQQNGGAAKARNTGLKMAVGDYIAFNDSDDEWIEGKIAKQIEYLDNNTDVHLLGCRYGDSNYPKGSMAKSGFITFIGIQTQIFKNYFQPPTVIFRRCILEKAGYFNESLRYAEEGFFFNNIVYHYKSAFMNIKVAQSITHKKQWGESGLSGNLWEMEKGELFNIKTAYKNKYISFKNYVLAYTYSFIKYIRRLIITFIRKLTK